MTYAKQSTAKTFLLGPILDSTGAAKTDEVVASIKVTKNGTVGAVDAQDTLTHNHTGHYVFVSDGGDFDTLGEVEFTLNSGTNAMGPVKFQVLPANVYDSLVSGSDTLDVQTTGISNDAITAAAIANGAIDAATFAADVDAEAAAWVWNAATASYGTAGTYGALIESGNVGGGAIVAASVTGAVGSVTGNVGGNVTGSVGSVVGAVGSVTGNVGGNVTGSVGSVASGGITATSIAADAIGASELAADAVAEIADAVWDELLSGHAGAGSAGLALSTASSGGVDPSVLADAIWDEALSGHSTAGTAGKALTDVLQDTGTDIPATLATINGYVDCLPATWVTVPTAAQVSTQVASDLASAHGAGSWVTATGFSTHSAADVVTAMGTGSTLTALAPASTALSTVVWTNTKAGYIDAAISTAGGGSLTAADIADAVWDELATGHIDTGKAGAQLWTVINTLTGGAAVNITSTTTIIESE